ncbi:tautomerase family protein [Nocardia sp. KC 131]|uniref:tautomerase family protein n=1 Tax=Nocardia arseniciresistens TaxID=3392119 RepID=UPI00398F6E14
MSGSESREAPVDTQEWIMPNVTIQQLPKTPELKRALVAKIADAFVDAYQIPAETVHVWFEEYPADGYGVAGKLIADK